MSAMKMPYVVPDNNCTVRGAWTCSSIMWLGQLHAVTDRRRLSKLVPRTWRLVDWLNNWLIDWLIDWLINCLPQRYAAGQHPVSLTSSFVKDVSALFRCVLSVYHRLSWVLLRSSLTSHWCDQLLGMSHQCWGCLTNVGDVSPMFIEPHLGVIDY